MSLKKLRVWMWVPEPDMGSRIFRMGRTQGPHALPFLAILAIRKQRLALALQGQAPRAPRGAWRGTWVTLGLSWVPRCDSTGRPPAMDRGKDMGTQEDRRGCRQEQSLTKAGPCA